MGSFLTPIQGVYCEASLMALHRLAQPEEIGKVCLFLATDGSFLTGEVVRADGGTSHGRYFILLLLMSCLIFVGSSPSRRVK